MSEGSNSPMPMVLAVGVVVMLLIVGIVYFVNQETPSSGPPPEQPLPMGAAEQAYVPQIQFLDPVVSRATNFLNQEVTFVFGTVQNNGTRSIRQIEVQLEFHDVFGQVVLRDRVRLFSRTARPLPPNGAREFQLNYEHIPVQWNQAYPSVEITGLLLE